METGHKYRPNDDYTQLSEDCNCITCGAMFVFMNDDGYPFCPAVNHVFTKQEGETLFPAWARNFRSQADRAEEYQGLEATTPRARVADSPGGSGSRSAAAGDHSMSPREITSRTTISRNDILSIQNKRYTTHGRSHGASMVYDYMLMMKNLCKYEEQCHQMLLHPPKKRSSSPPDHGPMQMALNGVCPAMRRQGTWERYTLQEYEPEKESCNHRGEQTIISCAVVHHATFNLYPLDHVEVSYDDPNHAFELAKKYGLLKYSDEYRYRVAILAFRNHRWWRKDDHRYEEFMYVQDIGALPKHERDDKVLKIQQMLCKEIFGGELKDFPYSCKRGYLQAQIRGKNPKPETTKDTILRMKAELIESVQHEGDLSRHIERAFNERFATRSRRSVSNIPAWSDPPTAVYSTQPSWRQKSDAELEKKSSDLKATLIAGWKAGQSSNTGASSSSGAPPATQETRDEQVDDVETDLEALDSALWS